MNKRIMIKTRLIVLCMLSCLTVLICSCGDKGVPRPRGHFRIDLPEKAYTRFDSTCPFTFEYPVYSVIRTEAGMNEYCWFNIEFPQYRAKLHLSYMNVGNELSLLTEDAHILAYKHSVKADAIEEKLWINKEKNVYGIIYLISGDAASSVQFFVTDSLSHYLRGSLYFDAQPDKDSLAPVISFFRDDIVHLIETLEWQ
ncbi:MAG: gliding motility lipoprotein GldD [Bacteroidales bacterium]|nr:gliding motility lipoprotein GldD [Bacteroidales bacterium]